MLKNANVSDQFFNGSLRGATIKIRILGTPGPASLSRTNREYRLWRPGFLWDSFNQVRSSIIGHSFSGFYSSFPRATFKFASVVHLILQIGRHLVRVCFPHSFQSEVACKRIISTTWTRRRNKSPDQANTFTLDESRLARWPYNDASQSAVMGTI